MAHDLVGRVLRVREARQYVGDALVGDLVEINGRNVYRSGTVAEKGQNLFPEDGDNEDMRCAIMGVFAPVVGITGSLQAAEALKVLTGIGEPLVGRLLLRGAPALHLSACAAGTDALGALKALSDGSAELGGALDSGAIAASAEMADKLDLIRPGPRRQEFPHAGLVLQLRLLRGPVRAGGEHRLGQQHL